MNAQSEIASTNKRSVKIKPIRYFVEREAGGIVIAWLQPALEARRSFMATDAGAIRADVSGSRRAFSTPVFV